MALNTLTSKMRVKTATGICWWSPTSSPPTLRKFIPNLNNYEYNLTHSTLIFSCIL